MMQMQHRQPAAVKAIGQAVYERANLPIVPPEVTEGLGSAMANRVNDFRADAAIATLRRLLHGTGAGWSSYVTPRCRASLARRALCVVLLLVVTAGTIAAAEANRRPKKGEPAPHRPPNVVLITLDTTRADRISGCGSNEGHTPFLKTIAATGVCYSAAVSVAPLTLPAHATLLTGQVPAGHGAVDNGTSALAAEVPTLASILAGSGYQTAAVVASRVLDRRFGLDRGFQTYDDSMTAEKVGEYGYAERDAEAVTTAALGWLSTADRSRALFLWVHYYDAHAPYEPPDRWLASAGGAYEGEIAFVDDQVRRLLKSAGLEPSPSTVVAVVGDHGESLGEHGESRHGVFLYGATLNVPLVVAGGGLPAGKRIDTLVGIRQLPSTLLKLLNLGLEADLPGPSLPLPDSEADDSVSAGVFSETRMPRSAYGWSPLKALTREGWRYIEAPRPELYDLKKDPNELDNVVDRLPDLAMEMHTALAALVADVKPVTASEPVIDAELAASLMELGYLSGMSGADEGGSLDPKDGMRLLERLNRAKALLETGQVSQARAILIELVDANPGNVPFRTHLARAQLAAGDTESAIATYRSAIELNPSLHFLHLNLADAELAMGDLAAARSSFERALELYPRSARAWIALAEIAGRQGEAERELQLLEEAVAAGTCSAVIETRLAQLALGRREYRAAAELLRSATERAPGFALAWMLLGETELTLRRLGPAADAFSRAAELPGVEFSANLALARVLERSGDIPRARRAAAKALDHAPDPQREAQARAVLARLTAP